MQDVGLSAGAGQTREEEDRGPGGRVGMRGAVVVVEPIQRDLPSIRCLDELTAETSDTHATQKRPSHWTSSSDPELYRTSRVSFKHTRIHIGEIASQIGCWN